MPSYLEKLLRQLAGATGSAIDTIGGALGDPFGQGTGGIDISSTLQNYGGNIAGSLRDAIVPTAYAAEPWRHRSPGAGASGSWISNSDLAGGGSPDGVTQNTADSGGGGFVFLTNFYEKLMEKK